MKHYTAGSKISVKESLKKINDSFSEMRSSEMSSGSAIYERTGTVATIKIPQKSKNSHS